MAKQLLLTGPDLNLLASPEPALCGRSDLADFEASLTPQSGRRCGGLSRLESGAAQGLIERTRRARAGGIGRLRPSCAAFTRTGGALRDALPAVAPPLIGIHLSNTFARGGSASAHFRRHRRRLPGRHWGN